MCVNFVDTQNGIAICDGTAHCSLSRDLYYLYSLFVDFRIGQGEKLEVPGFVNRILSF